MISSTIRNILAGSVFAAMAFSCGSATSTSSDPSMYLTGTEEQALTTVDADAGTVTYSCASPKKALVCHIPPGNPANAHTICVGKSAVDPHVRNHGDFLGACGDADGGVVVVPAPDPEPSDETDAGQADPGPVPGPGADAGSIG